jgi:hypothetical protein
MATIEKTADIYRLVFTDPDLEIPPANVLTNGFELSPSLGEHSRKRFNKITAHAVSSFISNSKVRVYGCGMHQKTSKGGEPSWNR